MIIKECTFPLVTLKEDKNQNLVKTKIIEINEYLGINLECLKEEIKIQSELAEQYPDIVLGAKIEFKPQQQHILAEITYDCKRSCTPILEYTKTLAGEEGKAKKLEICCQLIKICAWMQKNQIPHRNIKPSNIFYYEGKVLLSDFGSQRTFHLNYFGKYTNQNQNNWRVECLFYCCGEILKIIKENTDYDLATQDLLEWNDIQDSSSSIFNDIWVIGIIILEIIAPTPEILHVPLQEFYGLNDKKLQEKLQVLQKQINEEFYNQIQKLLSKQMFYHNIEEICKQIQQTLNQQSQRVLEKISIDQHNQQENELVLQPYKIKQQIEFFYNLNTLNNQSQILNLSIINFAELQDPLTNFSQYQSRVLEATQIIQINRNNEKKQNSNFFVTNDEKRVKEETQKCINKLKSLLLKNKSIGNFNNSYFPHKIKKLLKFDHLIWMNKTEIDQYEVDLNNYHNELEVQKSKKGLHQVLQKQIEKHQEMIQNAKYQLQWRRNALKLLELESLTDRSFDQFLFYLNDDEFTFLFEQKKQVYMKIDQKYRNQKRELMNAIAKYQCYGQNTFELDQLENISMAILKNSEDDLLINAYQKKEKLRNELGIEWLDFNKSMYFTQACEEFIKTGNKIFQLKSKASLDALPEELQQKYKNDLKLKISQNLPDKQEVFETALFLIEKEEPFKPQLQQQFKRAQVALANREVNPFIARFIPQFFSDFSFKKNPENRIYFRDLKLKNINKTIQQQYKDSRYNCYYSGFVINNIPNGFGYSILGENILFIGIFRNNKIFKGWSIIQKWGKNIYFSKGKFVNGLMEGKGIQKKYKIVENNNQVSYLLIKESKGYFTQDKLNDFESDFRDKPSTKFKYNQDTEARNEYFEGKFQDGKLYNGRKKIGINGDWINLDGIWKPKTCQLI